jgi:mannosyltransferase OCH1-like enzyme
MTKFNSVSFSQAMKNSSGYASLKENEKWSILADLYNRDYDTSIQKIPKIIHQVWLGSTPPPVIIELVESIKAANPSFKHRLWTDKDVQALEFKNKEIFNKCTNFGQKSDILRYALLEQFGGVYLDTDFVGVKSFESLLHLDFFTGIAYDSEPTMFNGLIGSTKNNTLIRSLNDINMDNVEDNRQCEHVFNTTGPWYMGNKFFNEYKNVEAIVALPVSFFYAYPNFTRDQIKGTTYNNYIEDESICVHLWHSSWM